MSNPTPFSLVLGGVSRPILWGRGAMKRSCRLGLPAKWAARQFDYDSLTDMIWAMLDDAGRKALPSPDAVAELVPMKDNVAQWHVVMKAYAEGDGFEDDEVKKATGGTAPLPASN